MSENNAQQMAVDVAVIKEQLKIITDEMREARSARKAQYEQNERQSHVLQTIDHRLQIVEAFVIDSKPTLQEYRDLRVKIHTAGLLGRFLYALAGATIGMAAALVAYWQKWFS